MPPSAITGTPRRRARREAVQIADSCGMPAPLTTRVVQIDPAPTPTLTASAPASARVSTPSSVTTLPAMTGSSGHPPLIRSIALITPAEWPWAVSMVTASTPWSTECVDARLEIVADADGGGAAQPPGVVAAGVGELLALLDVLDGDQPGESAGGVDERQLLDAVLLQDRLGRVERRSRRAR